MECVLSLHSSTFNAIDVIVLRKMYREEESGPDLGGPGVGMAPGSLLVGAPPKL